MKKKKLSLGYVVSLILLAVVATFNVTFFISAEYYNSRLSNIQDEQNKYSKWDEITKIVEKNFIGEYDANEAMEYGYAGYIAGLGDQWSGYYSADQTKQLMESDSNTYVGIGVTMSTEINDIGYVITAVTADGPAEAAGVKPFDVITAVDAKNVKSFESYTAMADCVRGEEDTVVKITVQRGEAELTMDIVRKAVYNESIKTKMLDGSIGYVAISGFENNVDTEFSTKVDKLIGQGAKALIFDVRFNPGGYASVMGNMLDKLLPEGMVISMTDKNGKTSAQTSDAACIALPMAVITNKYSISAAEFFAAALQEYGVAQVVGDKTGGKGYSQQTITLSDGSSINLSVDRYFTPKGNSLANVGVTPDVEIALPEELLSQFYSLTLEQDVQLKKAMEVINAKIAPAPAPTPAPAPAPAPAPTPTPAP